VNGENKIINDNTPLGIYIHMYVYTYIYEPDSHHFRQSHRNPTKTYRGHEMQKEKRVDTHVVCYTVVCYMLFIICCRSYYKICCLL
jgi:hypothetical protein